MKKAEFNKITSKIPTQSLKQLQNLKSIKKFERKIAVSVSDNEMKIVLSFWFM